MKRSLAHLPEHKRDELKRATDIIVERVPTAQMIILFGNYARGGWVEDVYGEDGVIYEYRSDFDILVITEDKATATKDGLWEKVDEQIARTVRRTPVNIIAHYMAEVNRKIEEGYYLFTDIKREGIVLHDTGRYKLVRRRKLDPVKRWQTAEEDFQFWFKKAKDFFDDYKTNIERKRYSQAAEQAYNAVLLVFTGYKPKLHNLTKLGRKAGNADPAFFTIFPKDTEEQKRLFSLLRDAYVDARYRKSYQIELRTLAERVSALHELTERVCREKIEQLVGECGGAG